MIVKIGFGGGFKRVGFDVDVNTPKLSANFTTGTYKQNGITKTFADLFTFTRAGKAWLVKDSGLQEYAIDVPRFDGGLLIEQAATNISKYSTLPENLVATKGNVIFRDGFWFKDTTAASGYLYVNLATAPTGQVTVSVKPLNAGLFDVCIYGGGFLNLTQNTKLQTASSNAAGTGFFGLSWRSQISEMIAAIYLQVEAGANATSPIETTTTPVTRPADFLANKITGTTVTGDWDSTLTLSIVGGQLVHSGYGTIRTLEIT